jgi:hypothetical protein
MNQQDRCLDPGAVRLLIAEELPAGELSRVAVHLGTCHACRDNIVLAAGGPQGSPGGAAQRIAQALTRGSWARRGEPALGAGDVVGVKYRLIALIGEGGSSSVWRAERLDWRAPVALKLLVPPSRDSREFIARFEREVRLAAALRSPNVAQILDQGVDDRTGQPFIALELLEGETLEQRLKRSTRLSGADTAVILTQVARALSRAHALGIVHRDLKPGNIFIARDLDQELVKVLDFGVAKSRVAPGSQSLVTTPGTVLGTPCYMSPEQIRASGELDQHGDLWGLAVIACECLTGRKPFDGKGFLAVALSVLDESKRPVPSQLGPSPAAFDAWFARATHPDRKRRFQTAGAALNALLPICKKAPGRARASAFARLLKYVVFSGAVGISAALWFGKVRPQRRTQAPGAGLSVATSGLVADPAGAAQTDATRPPGAPPAVQARAAPRPVPSLAPATPHPIKLLSSPQERSSVEAAAPRKAPRRSRGDALDAAAASAGSQTPATPRALPGSPEGRSVLDDPPVRIDLAE